MTKDRAASGSRSAVARVSLTTRRDIVVIGGSAGSMEGLLTILQMLPPDLDAAVFVVTHSSPDSPGLLPRIIGRVAPLPVRFATDGERIRRGRIYVAKPDCHLLVNQSRVAVVRGPKENGFRPAVDPLFRTAANAHGARVIGVLLSGGLDDGSYGLAAIKGRGGVTIVQEIAEAPVPSMPTSALQRVDIDYGLPVSKMASTIATLVPRNARKTRVG